MEDDFLDPMIEAPISCEETTEYDNRIEDDGEIEPEEEQEERDFHYLREEREQEFARYERNYRARRIRELTLDPVYRRGKRIRRPHSTKIAA